MKAFVRETGIAVPLDAANVDTDQIIPKQFLKSVTKIGFGKHLFHDWRYLDDAENEPNPEFVLNEKRYEGAKFLLARENFGNGSSREHAPWALADYGFRAIIAPSFSDIFYNNSLNNGLVCVKLTADEVDQLFRLIRSDDSVRVTVDLEKKTVSAGSLEFSFPFDDFRCYCILNGLDNIALTLRHEDQIKAFENSQPAWV